MKTKTDISNDSRQIKKLSKKEMKQIGGTSSFTHGIPFTQTSSNFSFLQKLNSLK